MKEEEQKEPTKKEKANEAGKDVAEVVGKGAANYLGGPIGGAVYDKVAKTKVGQKALGMAGKTISRNPLMRNALAKNATNIKKAKPLLNSAAGGIGSSSSTPSAPKSQNPLTNPSESNHSEDTAQTEESASSNNDTKGKEAGSGNISISTAFKKLPLKVKLIIIGGLASLAFSVIFIVVMLTPLMELGIIDIDGIGGGLASGNTNYTSTSSSINFWWPIGSRETTTTNGITYANGDPETTTITSHFGTRADPFSGQSAGHNGLDIAGNGQNGVINVIATRDGTVTYPTEDSPTNCPSSTGEDDCGGGFGNYIMIQHNDGKVTLYAHLDANTISVKAGDTVKQGQVIAKMGSSGRSTGTHLHFEVRIDGNRVDPENYVDSNNPRPVNTSTSHINGSTNQQTVCLSLKANNFSENGVIALMTNINHESGFNPNVLGDNNTSLGICQWHEGRMDNLKTSYPNCYDTIDCQISFLIGELKNGYSSLYNSLLEGSTSASDLTYLFCKEFERPYDTEKACRTRGSNAINFTTYVQNNCN